MNQHFKHAFALLMAVVMVFGMFPASAMAAPAESASATTAAGATATISTVSGKPGDLVAMDITVENAPGLNGFVLFVEYDKALTLKAVEFNPALTERGGMVTTPEPYKNPQQLTFIDWEKPLDINGVFATLTFQISETAEDQYAAPVRLSYNPDDVNNDDGNVPLTTVDGAVNVYHGLPGDINADDKVNTKDAILLFRYVAGWSDLQVDSGALDCNGDGKANTKDAVLLFRYIAGWPVEITRGRVHIHTMEAVPYKAAACTEAGNIAYWHCTACGKYYNDEKGTRELTLEQTVIPATGHTIVTDPYVAPTYESSGWTEGSHCSKCNKVIVAQEEIPPLVKNTYPIRYYLYDNDQYLMEKVKLVNDNPDHYVEGEELRLLNMNTPGYVFEGWYDGAGKDSVRVKEIPSTETGPLELYAHWTPVTYTIQFESPLDPITPVTYTINTGTTLRNPSWYGYIFAGWSDKDNKLVSNVIPQGTIGNFTLRANWTSRRNQTIPYNLADKQPIIHETDGQIMFLYDLGRIENVPLHTIKDFGWQSRNGIHWTEELTTTWSISEEDAQSVAKSISKATTNSAEWNLSKEWSQNVEMSQDVSSEVSTETIKNAQTNYQKTGTWEVGSSYGTTHTTTDDYGVSAKIGGSKSMSASVPLMGMTFGGGYTISGEIGGHYDHTTEDTTTYNRNSSYSGSSTFGRNTSITNSMAQKVGQQWHYGQSSMQGGSESYSRTVTAQKSESREYTTSFTYSTTETKTVTKSFDNTNAEDGYYRIVAAGTVHVIGWVIYDVATKSFMINSFNVVDDEVKEFFDYSASTGTYDDLENGVLPFEIPMFVKEYVNSKTLRTQGLAINDAGIVTEYTGEADYVMIPEKISVNYEDGTQGYRIVKGIAPGAFKDKTNVIEVKLPDTITAIPNEAFMGCTSLRNVIGKSIKTIGTDAFNGCTSLDQFKVTSQVTELGDRAFANAADVKFRVNNVSVLNHAVASGAKRITVNLYDLQDTLSNTTYTIPASTDYFAFEGATKTFDGVCIHSDAKETVINGATFNNCPEEPLVMSSDRVTLNRVTVNADGLAMRLKAPKTALTLAFDNRLNTTAGTAVITNSIALSLANSENACMMYVDGDMFVSGTLEGQEYLQIEEPHHLYICETGKFVVTFDPGEGTVDEASREVIFAEPIGKLPVPVRANYNFGGWYTAPEGGELVTSETIMTNGKDMTLYARWSAEPYTVSWKEQAGYTVTVTRTESPYAQAAIGKLSNGAQIFYGDVLEIQYTVHEGYDMGSTGITSATVERDLTSADIYAEVTPNTRTYNIVYKSTNGTHLGSSTATYRMGTTNQITPRGFSGYDTPESQNVKWDSVEPKTITFVYRPSGVANLQKIDGGNWWVYNGTPRLTYKVELEYRNRTASSVEVRVVWTNYLKANNYFGFSQAYNGSVGGQWSHDQTICSTTEWKNPVNYDRSKTVYGPWLTVSLNTTNRTTVSANGNMWDQNGKKGTWSGTMSIPAY